jgi:hypothetical protein
VTIYTTQLFQGNVAADTVGELYLVPAGYVAVIRALDFRAVSTTISEVVFGELTTGITPLAFTEVAPAPSQSWRGRWAMPAGQQLYCYALAEIAVQVTGYLLTQ